MYVVPSSRWWASESLFCHGDSGGRRILDEGQENLHLRFQSSTHTWISSTLSIEVWTWQFHHYQIHCDDMAHGTTKGIRDEGRRLGHRVHPSMWSVFSHLHYIIFVLNVLQQKNPPPSPPDATKTTKMPSPDVLGAQNGPSDATTVQ